MAQVHKNSAFHARSGARTLDTLSKSQVLYQLSYKRIVFLFAVAKVRRFFYSTKLFRVFFLKKHKKSLKFII